MSPSRETAPVIRPLYNCRRYGPVRAALLCSHISNFAIDNISLCLHTLIFASQGLRSALLIFTLGIVRRIFVIPAHCHLLDFDSYAPCNNVIFSQSTGAFHFLSLECPENWLEIIIGSLSLYKPFVRIV